MPIQHFDGKVAVVTGAASGIGFALCQALAAHGCHVAMLDKNPEISRIASSLSNPKTKITGHLCDVSSPASMSQVVTEIVREHGAVHVLINNAGVSLAGSFEASSPEDFEWLMRINFFGVIYGCRHLLPILRQQSEAHIVNVCSSFGLLGFAKKSAYCASKFAVRGFSESLRAELSQTHIGVTVLYPGPVATNLLMEGRSTSEAQRQQENQFLSSRAIPAAYVAARTLRGIQRNSARVLLSVDYRAIDWLTRLSPWLAQKVTSYASRKMPF
jgi:NAD(P)-dependent dehydrogenase (short-subunit alcohol dehydrogenase family)